MTNVTHARLLSLTGLLAVGAVLGAPTPVPAGATSAPPARHELYPVPPGGSFTIHGRGYGHGHGMSQWGAYGAAAVDKLSAHRILAFYYPHTRLVTEPAGQQIRVLLSQVPAPSRGYVQVQPVAGLTARYGGAGHVLPTRTAAPHHRITAWRIQETGHGLVLRDQSRQTWHRFAQVGSRGRFDAGASAVPVAVPGGVVDYRGSVLAELHGTTVEAVNRLSLEDYLYGVVPAEMPASWPAASLRAQAVAARTYAAHGLAAPKASWYDVDGDTRDQAYTGKSGEAAASNAAVQRTAGQVLEDGEGRPIFAQFGSANGGWTASGGVAYLPARRDPYDGAVPNTAHAWTTTLSAAAIAAAFPQLGSLHDIVVTGRDGNGLWGGRVTTATLEGSHGSVDVTGEEFRSFFGLRSTWWRPTPTPAAPRRVTATRSGRTVTVSWSAPHRVRGAAAVGGYRVTLGPGGPHRTVSAGTRKVGMRKVAARKAATATVVATSDAGPGPAVTVSVSAG